MSSPYQEFVRKAKERYEENKKKKLLPKNDIEFTAHARYKMTQYGLSEQKVKSVIRHPKRTEKGIAPKTAAVMQPVSPKLVDGKESWKQELWVMYVCPVKSSSDEVSNKIGQFHRSKKIRIISAWRYPGISPKRSPIPAEIWQELEDGGILETT